MRVASSPCQLGFRAFAPQRGLLVADSVAALCVIGGSAVFPSRMRPLTSDLAGALRRGFGIWQRRRSRLEPHLLELGLRRAGPPAFAVYTCCLQFSTLCSRDLIDVASFPLQWAARQRCAGPVKSLGCALVALVWRPCACDLVAILRRHRHDPVAKLWCDPGVTLVEVRCNFGAIVV